jgi:hypothetical protein
VEEDPAPVYAKGKEPKNFTAFRVCERKYKNKKTALDDCIDLHDLKKSPLVVEKSAGVYTLKNDSGFTFIPNFLSKTEQVELLTDCISWPGLSNLDNHFAHLSRSELFSAVAESSPEFPIERKPHPDDSKKVQNQPIFSAYNGEQQVQLLRRLRWISIGQQYDWSSKDYFDLFCPIPEKLGNLCQQG